MNSRADVVICSLVAVAMAGFVFWSIRDAKQAQVDLEDEDRRSSVFMDDTAALRERLSSKGMYPDWLIRGVVKKDIEDRARADAEPVIPRFWGLDGRYWGLFSDDALTEADEIYISRWRESHAGSSTGDHTGTGEAASRR